MNKRGRLKKRLIGYTFTKAEICNLDVTLAKYCAEGVRQFINMERHVTPANLERKEWEQILKDIHWSLNSIATDYRNEPFYQAVAQEKKNPGIESANEYAEKIERGLTLFGKYFVNLWY